MQTDVEARPEMCETDTKGGSSLHISVGVQAGSGGKCFVLCLVFLRTKRGATIGEQLPLEVKIQELQQALEEANERLKWLENACLRY